MKKVADRTINNNERGFTVLEVMISLAILAGVVVTVLTSLSHHLGVVSENGDLVVAAILGREKVEEIALFGMPKKTSGVFGGESERFSWVVTARDTEFDGLKRIDLSVRWEDDRDISFVSFLKK